MKQPLSALLLFSVIASAGPVPLSDTWTFFNPEGNSTIGNQSATGFEVEIFDVAGNTRSANTTTITSIKEGPLANILVTAPGHGLAAQDEVIITGTSVAQYNTGPVPVAFTDDADTFEIDIISYSGDATGGEVGISLAGNAVRPRVYQVHDPVDLSQIGAAYSCSFELELGTQIFENNRGDLHLFWGDTVTNSEFLAVIHLGPNPGRDDAIKMRIDNEAFNLSPVPGDSAEGPLGVGGNSWDIEAHYPQPNGDREGVNRLNLPGSVHRFLFTLVRVSATELAMLLKWQIVSSTDPNQIAGDGTELYALRYEETTGNVEGRLSPPRGTHDSDAWGVDPDAPRGSVTASPGALSQINFCGFMLHDDDPFDQDDNDFTMDAGTVIFRDWEVGCRNYFEELQRMHDVIRDPITGATSFQFFSFQDDSSSGSRYRVLAGASLQDFPDQVEPLLVPNASGFTELEELFPPPDSKRFYRAELLPRPEAD